MTSNEYECVFRAVSFCTFSAIFFSFTGMEVTGSSCPSWMCEKARKCRVQNEREEPAKSRLAHGMRISHFHHLFFAEEEVSFFVATIRIRGQLNDCVQWDAHVGSLVTGQTHEIGIQQTMDALVACHEKEEQEKHSVINALHCISTHMYDGRRGTNSPTIKMGSRVLSMSRTTFSSRSVTSMYDSPRG